LVDRDCDLDSPPVFPDLPLCESQVRFQSAVCDHGAYAFPFPDCIACQQRLPHEKKMHTYHCLRVCVVCWWWFGVKRTRSTRRVFIGSRSLKVPQSTRFARDPTRSSFRTVGLQRARSCSLSCRLQAHPRVCCPVHPPRWPPHTIRSVCASQILCWLTRPPGRRIICRTCMSSPDILSYRPPQTVVYAVVIFGMWNIPGARTLINPLKLFTIGWHELCHIIAVGRRSIACTRY